MKPKTKEESWSLLQETQEGKDYKSEECSIVFSTQEKSVLEKQFQICLTEGKSIMWLLFTNGIMPLS